MNAPKSITDILEDADTATRPDRTLKECLARYMDPAAFNSGVPDSVKFTSGQVGRVLHDKLKDRRAIAMRRAESAIRFFSRPENRERLDARAAAKAREERS